MKINFSTTQRLTLIIVKVKFILLLSLIHEACGIGTIMFNNFVFYDEHIITEHFKQCKSHINNRK